MYIDVITIYCTNSNNKPTKSEDIFHPLVLLSCEVLGDGF